MILLKIAWRNLWRNPLRSGIVILAMVFGIVVMIFVSGFYTGLMGSYVKNSIKKQYGHIQIHHPAFREYLETKNEIKTLEKAKKTLDEANLPYAPRTIAMGLASVAGKNQAIKIIGVDTAFEKNISSPQDYLIEGKYLSGTKRNPVYISSSLANKLGLKLRKKIKLSYADETGTNISIAGKITGIYDMKNKLADLNSIYVNQSDLNKNLINKNYCNEIIVRIPDIDYSSNEIDLITQDIQSSLPALEVASWKEVAPELNALVGQVKTNQIVVRTIILIALVFGILNTLLMSVLERKYEIGMMLAIGLNKAKTMLLIIIESLCLSAVAGPLGIILSNLMIMYFAQNGLDLSVISKSLETWGIDPIIIMKVNPQTYWAIFILITLTNIGAAIYPAIKAMRLRPAEAIRK